MLISLTQNANHQMVAWHVNFDLGVAQIRSCDRELKPEASAGRCYRDGEL